MVGVAGLFAQEPGFEHVDLVDKGLIFLGLLGLFNQRERVLSRALYGWQTET